MCNLKKISVDCRRNWSQLLLRMKDRRIPKFMNEYTPNWQKKRGSTTENLETPIRMKM